MVNPSLNLNFRSDEFGKQAKKKDAKGAAGKIRMQPKRLLNRKKRRPEEHLNEMRHGNKSLLSIWRRKSLFPVKLFHFDHLLYILRIATFQFLFF